MKNIAQAASSMAPSAIQSSQVRRGRIYAREVCSSATVSTLVDRSGLKVRECEGEAIAAVRSQ